MTFILHIYKVSR